MPRRAPASIVITTTAAAPRAARNRPEGVSALEQAPIGVAIAAAAKPIEATDASPTGILAGDPGALLEPLVLTPKRRKGCRYCSGGTAIAGAAPLAAHPREHRLLLGKAQSSALREMRARSRARTSGEPANLPEEVVDVGFRGRIGGDQPDGRPLRDLMSGQR